MGDILGGHLPETERAPLAKKVGTVAWGLFFIWVGVAFLANLGWGVGLLGVGAITVGAQFLRKYLGLPAERFWAALGVLFLLWGGFALLGTELRRTSIPGGLTPIAFIALGIVLVAYAILRKR